MFGRNFIHDYRDKKYQLVVPKAKINKRYWSDNRYWGDQKNTSACVGFAWSHWLSCAPIRNWLRPEAIYELAKHLDQWHGTDYEGTSVRAGAKLLQKLGFIDSYAWATNLQVIIDTILQVGPVVVGTDWYSNMTDPDHRGYLHPSGIYEGGHAYLLTGVNCKQERFRMKQSWGRSWGRNGRAWISFEEFEILLDDAGECCLGVEVKL